MFIVSAAVPRRFSAKILWTSCKYIYISYIRSHMSDSNQHSVCPLLCFIIFSGTHTNLFVICAWTRLSDACECCKRGNWMLFGFCMCATRPHRDYTCALACSQCHFYYYDAKNFNWCFDWLPSFQLLPVHSTLIPCQLFSPFYLQSPAKDICVFLFCICSSFRFGHSRTCRYQELPYQRDWGLFMLFSCTAAGCSWS